MFGFAESDTMNHTSLLTLVDVKAHEIHDFQSSQSVSNSPIAKLPAPQAKKFWTAREVRAPGFGFAFASKAVAKHSKVERSSEIPPRRQDAAAQALPDGCVVLCIM